MTPGRFNVPAPLGLLAAASIVLAGVVVWELRGPDVEAVRPVAAPAGDTATPQAAAPAPGAEPAARWVATLLDRPPFSATRRPPGPDSVAAPLPDAPLPRLTGILVTPEGRSAIFAGQPQPLVVREGGILGRFSVQKIESGQVTLTGPDGPRILRPTFDANAPAPTPPGALPGLPRPGALPLAGAPPIPGGAPAVTSTFPSPADAPQDAMPFETMTTPSGAAILREQARQDAPPAAPR